MKSNQLSYNYSLRQLATNITSLLLIGVSILILTLASLAAVRNKIASENEIYARAYTYPVSLGIVVINKLLEIIFISLARWEKHHTRSAMNSSLISRIFYAQIVNSCISVFVVYYIYNPADWYSNGGGVEVTFAIMIADLIISVTLGILRQLRHKFTWWALKDHVLTQNELNKLAEGPEFVLGIRYINALKTIFLHYFLGHFYQ